MVADSGLCTYRREADFFSYRRATHAAKKITDGRSPPSRFLGAFMALHFESPEYQHASRRRSAMRKPTSMAC